MIDIQQMDVMEWATIYRGEKFHALLTDCPYELNFMNRKWDSSGISFQRETWAALAEHLYPGAFGMVFASARGWHRLACAIEDAGLIIHPSIFLWTYATGFPKATRLDTQIDKAAGVERESVIDEKWAKRYPNGPQGKTTQLTEGGRSNRIGTPTREISATPLAKTWEGYRYGLQCLKPAAEPIIIFQKPYVGKPIECITRTGAGALNIDGARIPTSASDLKEFERLSGFNNTQSIGGQGTYQGGAIIDRSKYDGSQGRWPANFILEHSPDCKQIGTKRVKGNGHYPAKRGRGSKRAGPSGHKGQESLPEMSLDREEVEGWICAPGCPVAALDVQSGTLTSGKPAGKQNNRGGFHQGSSGIDVTGFGDTGGASRFFFRVEEQIDDADPVYYTAKASRRERDAGLEHLEAQRISFMNTHGGDPEKGEEWQPLDDRTGRERNRFAASVRNPHPTVKPIALARYLATLLLPPAEYAPRRILVPFAGVMSEAIGCLMAGWEEVTTVERDAEYTEIGRARVQYWQPKMPPPRLL